MVPAAVSSQYVPDPYPESGSNIDPYQVHLVVTPTELDIIVDALRSVGNTELTDRFENVLGQFGQASVVTETPEPNAADPS